MKWLKIVLLLILTVAAMRATSWAMAWALARFFKGKRWVVAVAANLAGFAAFVALLNWNALPGEPVDWAAILFGLAVFALFAVSDFFWKPWDCKARPTAQEASRDLLPPAKP